MQMRNKILIAICLILVAFLLLNPSEKDFDAFANYDKAIPSTIIRTRTLNGFLFSTYQIRYTTEDVPIVRNTSGLHDFNTQYKEYFGICKIFFLLKQDNWRIKTDSATIMNGVLLERKTMEALDRLHL